MKEIKKVEILSSILISLSAITAFGQKEEPPPIPPFVLSLEDAVKPGMMNQYKESMKKWIELLKNEKVETMFNAFAEQNGIVNYLEPLSNLSEINNRALNKALEKFHNTEWGQKRQASLRWSLYSVWFRSDKLSYRPATPSTSPKGMVYFIWKHIRLRPEAEIKFNEIATKFKKVFQRQNIGRGYGVFRNIIGYEMPWYTVVFPGKDPGELYEWQNKIERELGDELKRILDELYDIADEITEGRGWTLQELSLINN